MDNSNKKLYSVKEFCDSYGISRSNFYNLLCDGIGPTTVKIGKRRMVPIEAAEKWLRHLEEITNEK